MSVIMHPARPESRTVANIPTGNQRTEFPVGAPRDELDFIGHLIEHCTVGVTTAGGDV